MAMLRVPTCWSHDTVAAVGSGSGCIWLQVHHHQLSEYCSTDGGPVVLIYAAFMLLIILPARPLVSAKWHLPCIYCSSKCRQQRPPLTMTLLECHDRSDNLVRMISDQHTHSTACNAEPRDLFGPIREQHAALRCRLQPQW